MEGDPAALCSDRDGSRGLSEQDIDPVRVEESAEWRAKKAEDKGRIGGAVRSSKTVRDEGSGCPRSARVSYHQPEQCSKGWEGTAQLDRNIGGGQPAALSTRDASALVAHGKGSRLHCVVREQAHLDAVMPHDLETGTPVFAATPISSEQWCGTNGKQMRQLDFVVVFSCHWHCSQRGQGDACGC